MSWDKVDWTMAPEWATHWAIDGDGKAFWYGPPSWREPHIPVNGKWLFNYQRAPKFDYPGHPRDSLTARPTEKTS